MGKLHELLAVEGDLRQKAEAALAKAFATLTSDAALLGTKRVYRPLVDGGEQLPEESKRLPTTVNEQLEFLGNAFVPWTDAVMQKEATNQIAATDLVIDSVNFGVLPATALLNLESKLASLKKVIEAIPTNDLSEEWTYDKERDAWVSKERITFRTVKEQVPLVLYDATDKHPAQVQLVTKDEKVGSWTTQIVSGMWSPQWKRKVLDRLETVMLDVKKARQQANDCEVEKVHVAEMIWEYILG